MCVKHRETEKGVDPPFADLLLPDRQPRRLKVSLVYSAFECSRQRCGLCSSRLSNNHCGNGATLSLRTSMLFFLPLVLWPSPAFVLGVLGPRFHRVHIPNHILSKSWTCNAPVWLSPRSALKVPSSIPHQCMEVSHDWPFQACQQSCPMTRKPKPFVCFPCRENEPCLRM